VHKLSEYTLCSFLISCLPYTKMSFLKNKISKYHRFKN
jgi:hypothetical protein